MGTPEEEAAKMRAEVVKEMEAEESGEALPVVDAVEEVEQKPGTQEDPWAGVDPALKKAFEEMSQEVTTLKAAETRLKQAELRIGAITQELHVAKQAIPSAEQMAEAIESDEKWDDLKKDFPEWAEAFDSRFDRKLNTALSTLKTKIDALKGQGATTEEIEKRLLSFAKPKWKETIASTEWKEWLAAQPSEVTALTESDAAADAVQVLNAFEEATKQKTATEIAAERKKRIKTAILPEGGKAIPLKSEADMNGAELRATIGKEVYAEA